MQSLILSYFSSGLQTVFLGALQGCLRLAGDGEGMGNIQGAGFLLRVLPQPGLSGIFSFLCQPFLEGFPQVRISHCGKPTLSCLQGYL